MQTQSVCSSCVWDVPARYICNHVSITAHCIVIRLGTNIMSINKRHVTNSPYTSYTPNMSNTDDIRSQLFNGRTSTSTSSSTSSGGMNHSSYNKYNNNNQYNQQNNNNHSTSNQSLFERENDDLADALSSKVSQLKQLTINIGSELKSSNEYLDSEFSGTLDQIQGNLKSSINQLMHTINTGGSKHMCYILIFVLLIFLFIWYLIR